MSTSTESIRVGRTLGDIRRSILERWEACDTRAQTAIKAAALLAVVLVAFHYSLSSLLQTVGYDTPLAYVGLVPVLALCLAWIHRIPRNPEPPIHDRQLDYILGLPLVGGALAVALVLPGRMGAMYWLDRIDLLLLPIFVAGATVLIFGTRVAWRQKLAIGYLLLAWPWPYTHILLGTLGGFTNATLSGLNAALRIIPVAQPVAGAANQGLFQVVHHGHAFPVSVVTACSGVDGMVGFFLVGAGFAGTVRGGRIRKLLWLAVGLALLWTTNLLRLLFIFWIGGVAGEHAAVNILHPLAGLAIFSLGVVLMMLLLRPFGLKLVDTNRAARLARAREMGSGAPRVFAAVGIVAIVGLLLGLNNSTLRAYDPVASASGEPKLGSFLAQPASPAGWAASWETEYTTNKPLFGQSSRWFRYIYTPSGGASDLYSSLPVTADVINAGGLGAFGQYGVAACYSFHGYTLRDVASVNLGDGIRGQTLSYTGSASAQDWSIVYWIWPVATSTGTRYERVILYLQNTGAGSVGVKKGQVPHVAGLKGALDANKAQERRLIVNRAFLVEFAKEVVQGQTRKTDTGINVATVVPGGARVSTRSGLAELDSSAPPNAASIFQNLHVSLPSAVAAQNAPKRGTLWQRLHVRPPALRPGSGLQTADASKGR